LAGLVFWEMRHRNPVVNFRPLGERYFAACSITRASVRICKASLLLGSPLAKVKKTAGAIASGTLSATNRREIDA